MTTERLFEIQDGILSDNMPILRTEEERKLAQEESKYVAELFAELEEFIRNL